MNKNLGIPKQHVCIAYEMEILSRRAGRSRNGQAAFVSLTRNILFVQINSPIGYVANPSVRSLRNRPIQVRGIESARRHIQARVGVDIKVGMRNVILIQHRQRLMITIRVIHERQTLRIDYVRILEVVGRLIESPASGTQCTRKTDMGSPVNA